MLLEVGFWHDTRAALRRGDSVAINGTHERSPLLQKSVTCPVDATQSTDEQDARRPDPTALVDHTWYMTHGHLLSMLEWYLTEGACVESHELAYSYCRFHKCGAAAKDPRVMGACTLTDGVYVWPEGYWHYIRHHHVKPPQAFLDHVTTNYRRALLAAKALSREFGDDVLFLWDAEFKKPVPVPAGMQQWILDNTTLQLPGSSKKTPVDVVRRPWDCFTSSLPNWCGCVIS